MNRLLFIIPAISLLNANPESKETAARAAAPKGMVWIEGATYTRGTKEKSSIPFNDEERPVHKVTVSGFYLDEHEVTNAQFREFVDATGYKTQAEKGWSKMARGRCGVLRKVRAAVREALGDPNFK